ncbi:preprotein translocase subunit SecG [Rhodobacter sp. 24-YEA-8]|uniref:preprotein translocase subunit SecG n=1 Tax=Rhodobacter sp. 24-YEA-8 TaxID=1884310 RepID=UPI0008952FAD|nr:preprotein translocase subunit SecG [Rhodobacter sp. 24-YEA-8]SEB54528.1 protein translocase subunit secG [Rhodobacter sp. 24-YEA-8]
METFVLTIHLILALLLIGVVLVQKSEGSALLSGGGNMQARAKPNGLTRVTWILAGAFIVTSLALTVLATRGASTGSVIDGLMPPAAQTNSNSPDISGMMPPPASGSTDPAAPPAAVDPAAPPADPAPAASAPAETAPAETAPEAAPETTPAQPAN